MTTQKKDCKTCDGCADKPAKWRTDFPIEWEGDHYVSRREMVKFLTLGSAILAASNWVTAVVWRFRHGAAFQERYIGSAAALQQTGSLLFRYPTDQDPAIAVSMPDGKVAAYSQVCTHLSCAVIYKQQENELFCPCHNGVFNVANGSPVSGPPTRALPKISVEQRGDQLFATGVEGS